MNKENTVNWTEKKVININLNMKTSVSFIANWMHTYKIANF